MERFVNYMVVPIRFVLCSALMLTALSSQAQVVDRFTETSVSVPLYKSKVLDLQGAAARVSIGNPDVADILILKANQIYVLGKDLGSTNVILWDKSDNLVGHVAVEVTHDLENLKMKLNQLLPAEPIEVSSVQRSIVLKGTVSSLAAMQSALDIADGYLAQIATGTEKQVFDQDAGTSSREDKAVGSVINMMQVGGAQQVMLAVKVAEISRQELKRMHAQFNALNIGMTNWNVGGVNGGATFPDAGVGPVFSEDAPWGPAIAEFAPTTMAIQNQGLFASFLTNNTIFNLAIDAAKENGLAKILAEPTLTTLTGEEAEFLSGGEFPIPVPQGDRQVTVEFREFGVELRFLPVVLGSGNINVKLNIAVSELASANSIGITTDESSSAFVVPSLTKRAASATVELQEGQTIAIAGLINDRLREIVTKFPGLGEIPVLGALFRSQEFVNNETELVIIVTPYLAKPMRQEDIILPTDNFVEPSDLDFYLFGRLEGRKKREASADSAAVDGDMESMDAESAESETVDTETVDQGPVNEPKDLAHYGHQIQ